MIKMEDAAWIKRKAFHYFMEVAGKVEKLRIANKAVPIGSKILYQIGRFLVYGPLTDNLGMKNVRVAYTAGEAIGPEIFEFFRSLGINLKQLYGMTESCALVSIQKDGDIDSETVGTPVPGVDIKIDENGEVLYKGPGNFTGYFKNDEATKETLVDGYVLSGDAGYITKQGHLKIIDRAKDVSKLTDGTLFPCLPPNTSKTSSNSARLSKKPWLTVRIKILSLLLLILITARWATGPKGDIFLIPVIRIWPRSQKYTTSLMKPSSASTRA
jgi:long-chain acyl-CoA synthetase